jgi:predicted nucleotidyltransferase
MENKQIVDELIEEIGNNQEIVKSFEVRDSLSNDIFDVKDGEFFMHDEIRKKLMDVTEKFMDYLDIEFFIHDVILTGSLANYNWSKYSDVDLHILVDYDETDYNLDLLKGFFNSKRSLWNKQHEILVKGFDCEIYVQDVNEPHHASGIYSVLNDEWVVTPVKTVQSIDKNMILKKSEDFEDRIDDISERFEKGEDVLEDIKLLKVKLKKFRQSGLDDGGEFSYENLAFKLLRRNGYIGKLLDIQTKTTDKKLSIEQ